MTAANFGRRFVSSFLDNSVGRALNPMPVGSGGVQNPLNLFNKEQASKLAKTSPSGFMQGAKNYFGGDSLMATPGGYAWRGARNSEAASLRQIAGAIAGGYAALSALDMNPLSGVARLAGHGAIGMGLLGMGGGASVAGMGYLAAAGVNTFRGGNNMGPM